MWCWWCLRVGWRSRLIWASMAMSVKDDWFYGPVVSLASRGVFAGTDCGEGFCPDEPLARWQMAVWLVRVLDGADPAPVSESRFGDVAAGDDAAPFVERLPVAACAYAHPVQGLII